MSKRITDITRKDIFILLIEGYIDDSISIFDGIGERITYAYNGGITELDFLNELYNLKSLPSKDSRYNNAYDDIYQHTINNNDWNFGWVFYDSRFNLKGCEDEELLKFICRIFHPIVRNENGCWKGLFERIQILLHSDGYELYVAERISGREVYLWRELTDLEIANNKFIPFSQRYKKCSLQIPSISINKRKALVELMHSLEERLSITDDTGWNYYRDSCEVVMDSIKEFYTPKAFNDKDKYVEECNFDAFVMHTSPKFVFDVIEFFSLFNNINFENEINTILSEYDYKLADRKMMVVQKQINSYLVQPIKKAFSSEYINEQIKTMLNSQSENPTESIGKAKELVESCCETILEYNGVIPNKDWKLNNLVDETMKLLEITPKHIPDTSKEANAIKAILGSLKGIATNIAIIRNAYGTGHGKSISYKGLEERHAKLAVGSSITLVNFLWDSHLRMLNKNNGKIK